jgi:ABC-type multidrug transport system permease subunit
MNDRIHGWLDEHELLKFLFVMVLAMGLSVFTSTWMIQHAKWGVVAYLLVCMWFVISRMIYLRKGGAL